MTPTTTMGGASVLPTDRPLTAGDVHLLREGDVLKVVRADAYMSKRAVNNGDLATFHASEEEPTLGIFISIKELPGAGMYPSRFTFVARPATSAASEGAGLKWPWSGDNPRHDEIRAAWESYANEVVDDDGKIDLSDVDTCVCIGAMKALSLAASPPAREEAPDHIADAGKKVPAEGAGKYWYDIPGVLVRLQDCLDDANPDRPNVSVDTGDLRSALDAFRARTSEPEAPGEGAGELIQRIVGNCGGFVPKGEDLRLCVEALEAALRNRTSEPAREQLAYWRKGHEIVEARLAKAVAARHEDAPFPMDAQQAALWHNAQMEAYRDALEMMGVPEGGPLIPINPAPATADKLKVAVEALEPFALLAPSEVSAGVNMGDPLSKWFTIAQLVAADQALATLNEEG